MPEQSIKLQDNTANMSDNKESQPQEEQKEQQEQQEQPQEEQKSKGEGKCAASPTSLLKFSRTTTRIPARICVNTTDILGQVARGTVNLRAMAMPPATRSKTLSLLLEAP